MKQIGRRLGLLTRGAAGAATLAFATPAAAQGAAQVAQPPNTRELGLDAGLTLGLGEDSSIEILVPGRVRIGYFLNNDSRWSVEPAVGLQYRDTEGADGALIYNLEAGALYHFRPPADVVREAVEAGGVVEEAARRGSVVYARPFINLQGVTGDVSDNEVSAGAGLGIKVPYRSGLAFRFETNLGYGFDNQALRLGALAGISYFPR